MNKYQKGNTLIIVMGLLVLITIIGTLAMKNSMTSLNIATNSQVRQLLMQSSDVAFFNVEDKTQIRQYIATNGLLGYLREDGDQEKELVFCLRSNNSRFFMLNKASVIYWESGKSGPTNNSRGTEGYCNVKQPLQYTTGRKAVMTQIAVRYTAALTEPLKLQSRGTSSLYKENRQFVVYSTSLMPSLARDATQDQINDCLSKHLSLAIPPIAASYDQDKPEEIANYNNGKISISECLTKLNVPHVTQVAEYSI